MFSGDTPTFEFRPRCSMYDAAHTFQNAWIRVLRPVGRIQRHRVSCLREIRNASRLVQQSESSNDKFTVQLKELQQLDVDVLVDYCSPANQRAVSKGDQ